MKLKELEKLTEIVGKKTNYSVSNKDFSFLNKQLYSGNRLGSLELKPSEIKRLKRIKEKYSEGKISKKKKFGGKINKSISYRAGRIAGTWNLYRNEKFLKQVGIDKFREIQRRKRL